MPCLVYDDQFAARPRPRKFPRGLQGAAQVESAVDEYAGGTGQAPGLPQQDPVLEPGVMAPVMGDEAREGHPEHRVVVAGIMPVVWAHPNVSVLPVAPVAGRLSTDGRIGLVQQSAVRTDEVALAVGLGHAVAEACPLFGEQPTDPPRDPLDLPASPSGDSGQDDLRDPVGVAFGVGQAQGRAPGPSEHQPALDAKLAPQQFDVREEVRRRVRREADGRVAGVWHAPAASSLVEQHDSVRAGVEVSTHTRGTSGAWAAVKDDGGLPSGLPQTSQYTRCPSPTSSMPCSYGSICGYSSTLSSLSALTRNVP